MIPKIIHQTAPSKETLHHDYAANIEHLKRLNARWEHMFYEDRDIESIIKKVYGIEMLKTYNSINPMYGAARADLFRYLLMYEFGGVYLDIKSSAFVQLDDFLREDDSYILSYWPMKPGEMFEGLWRAPELDENGELQQWHIIAEARHPFLKAVIAYVTSNISSYTVERFGVGGPGVLRVTGPVAYTLAIREIRTEYRHRLVNVHRLGLKYSIYEDKNKSGVEIARSHVDRIGPHYWNLRAPIIIREFFDENGSVIDLKNLRRNDMCPCRSGKRYKHCHGSFV